MASVSEIIESAFGYVTKEAVDTFKKHLESVFRNEVAQDLKKDFLGAYDYLAQEEKSQFPSPIRGEDPSALENWRHLFAQQLDRELADIKFQGDEIIINIGNKELLGFGETPPKKGEPQSVDWLGLYIEGIIGEFAFITEEQYKARGRRSSKPLGRFGAGFLMPKDRYKQERWEEVTGLKFEDVRHPISGQKPYKRFEQIPQRFDFGKYVNEALQRTVKSLS